MNPIYAYQHDILPKLMFFGCDGQRISLSDFVNNFGNITVGFLKQFLGLDVSSLEEQFSAIVYPYRADPDIFMYVVLLRFPEELIQPGLPLCPRIYFAHDQEGNHFQYYTVEQDTNLTFEPIYFLCSWKPVEGTKEIRHVNHGIIEPNEREEIIKITKLYLKDELNMVPVPY